MKELTTRFIIASIFVFCVVYAQSQPVIQSIQKPHQKALRFGVDLFSVVNSAINPDEMVINFHSDFHFKPDIYFAADGGFSKILKDEIHLDYKSNGTYLSLGVDKNMLKPKDGKDLDIVYIGVRYGIAMHQHSADSIMIDNYWANNYQSLASEKLSTQWVEFSIGMKSTLFFAKNIFVGWALKYRIKTVEEKQTQMSPYIIPGFGKAAKNSQVAFSWSLYYRIPFKKQTAASR